MAEQLLPAEPTLEALAEKLTHCSLQRGFTALTNRKTLARWVRKYGEAEVRQALEGGYGSVYFYGGGEYLAWWEWQLFGPIEEVYWMCL
jgi:hypothetical protein